MKTITVDFSSSKPVQPFYGGEVGENRAVYLDIIPSTDMSEDENIAIYYVAFTVEGGIILSETFNQGEDISISLGSIITEQRKVFFQLIATSSDGESVISKSPIVQLFLGKSITGEVIPDPVTGDTIYTEIARLVEAAEHIDLSEYYTKDEVDAIADSKVSDVQDEDGSSLVNEGVATIPKEVVEIYNQGVLIGTLAEINNMRRTKELKYQGFEFVYINQHTTSPVTYAVYYIRPQTAPQRPSLFRDIFNANYEITGAQEKVAEWSDENYTLSEKQKLAGIEVNAQVNVIESIETADGTIIEPVGKKITLPPIEKTVYEIQGTSKTGLEWYNLYKTSVLKYQGNEIIGAKFDDTTQIATFYYYADGIMGEGFFSISIDRNKSVAVDLAVKGTIHKHDNKSVLDKFGENGGNPTYNGNPIGGGGTSALTDDEIISVCSIIADFITDGTNIIGVDSTTALAF